ncbi:MAG: efflux transporter periplasmic adaptor subunit, partial [Prevotellaceae bacterium]|nr:efflux transporter periplasmic adaptor subunit [Prevotellaceae bacterium]
YKSGKAESRVVNTGLRTDSQVQILSGISVGDTLIISGILQLRDGTAVTLDNIAQ